MPPKSNQPSYPKKPIPPKLKGKLKVPIVSLKDSMARRLQKK